MLIENIYVGMAVRINNGEQSGRRAWNSDVMPNLVGMVGIVEDCSCNVLVKIPGYDYDYIWNPGDLDPVNELKVGNYVRINTGEISNRKGWVEAMEELIGDYFEITDISGGLNKYKADGWWWNPTDLDLVNGDEDEEEGENLETVMIKESNYVLDEETIGRLSDQAEHLLHNYDYNTTREALREIFLEWADKKGWLVDAFSKHPFYNGNFQIVIPAKLKRPIDRTKIQEFQDWAKGEYENLIAKEELMIGLHTYADYRKAKERLSDLVDNMCSGMSYKGRTYDEILSEYMRMSFRLNEVREAYSMSHKGKTIYVPRESSIKLNAFASVINSIDQYADGEDIKILTGRRLEKINNYLSNGGFNTRALEGQKIVKFVGKLLKEVGLNKVTNITTEKWMTPDGTVHQREKDMGYNYHFPLLGDAINPHDYEREIVISFNPIDYWTSSFGYKWASCHTIDKENIRGVGSNNHQGCYSGGTESYMLDPSTVVMYVRPTEEQLKEIGEEDLTMEEQSKFKRCLFFLGEDKIVQSRVYPDGRDGGDEGLAGQLRAIMQEVISTIYEVPNMWVLRKGTSACEDVIFETDVEINYKDWRHYSDCNVSYMKRVNGNRNNNLIEVGREHIICPTCGKKHTSQDHITCINCYEHRVLIGACEECGDEIYEGGYEIYTEDGHLYCCETCARNAGYVQALNGDEDWVWVLESETRRCEWSGSRYVEADWEDDSIEIKSTGEWYHNQYVCEQDNNIFCEYNGEWEKDSYAQYFSDSEIFFSTELTPKTDYITTEDGKYFEDAEGAEAHGYVLNEEGKYILAEAA